jgi:hypothetical protein
MIRLDITESIIVGVTAFTIGGLVGSIFGEKRGYNDGSEKACEKLRQSEISMQDVHGNEEKELVLSHRSVEFIYSDPDRDGVYTLDSTAWDSGEREQIGLDRRLK